MTFKLLAAFLLAAWTACDILAMPSQEESKKTEPFVRKLIEPEWMALKSGKKTHGEVAEVALRLALESDVEAVRLLLMKGAFVLYVKDGQTDKAVETMNKIETTIADLPPQSVTNMIELALLGLPKTDRTRLYRRFEATKKGVTGSFAGQKGGKKDDRHKAYDVQPGEAKTYYVNGTTGDDANTGLSTSLAKKTIQAAIAVAADGATIRVAAGTYDPIVTNNRDLTIIGIEGKGSTLIDGKGASRCAYLGTSTNECATVLSGFTLTNGYLYISWHGAGGAGVRGGTLNDCTIVNCRVDGSWRGYGGEGGGASDAVLNRCTIIGCKALAGGGVNYSSLNGCVIRECYAHDDGGAANCSSLRSCLVCKNYGYNIGGGACGSAFAGWCVAYNCTVADNNARSGGTINGGVLYNTIIYGNTPVNVESGWNRHESPCQMLDCMTDNPAFIDAANDDYRLSAGSQCIDVGNNSYVANGTDLAGNVRIAHGTVDIGCYEYQSRENLRVVIDPRFPRRITRRSSARPRP